jgi:hypothetical protein
MSFKHRVVMRVAALVLPGLLIAATAYAQTRAKDADRTVGSGVRAVEPGVPPAPIGHRQPRAADLPPTLPRDGSDEWLQRLNHEIDSKLKICRGC